MSLAYRSSTATRTAAARTAVPAARSARHPGESRPQRDHQRAQSRPRAVVVVAHEGLRREVVEQLAGAGFCVDLGPQGEGPAASAQGPRVAPRVAVVDLDSLDQGERAQLRRVTGPAAGRVIITRDRGEAVRRRTDRDETLLGPVTGVQVAAAALRVAGAPQDVILRWTAAVFDEAVRRADPTSRLWA